MSVANIFTAWLRKKQKRLKDMQTYKESLEEYEQHIKGMKGSVNTCAENTYKYGKFDVVVTVAYTNVGPIIKREIRDFYSVKSIIYEGYIDSQPLKEKYGISGYMCLKRKFGQGWNYGGKYFYSIEDFEVKAFDHSKEVAIIENKTFIDDGAAEYIGIAIASCFEAEISNIKNINNQKKVNQEEVVRKNLVSQTEYSQNANLDL